MLDITQENKANAFDASPVEEQTITLCFMFLQKQLQRKLFLPLEDLSGTQEIDKELFVYLSQTKPIKL